MDDEEESSMQKWYKENKEKHNENMKERYKKNKEQYAKTGKEWRKKNPDYKKEWVKNNSEREKEINRKHQKKRYNQGVGKSYNYTYTEAMRILREKHKDEFSEILKKLWDKKKFASQRNSEGGKNV